VKNLVVLKSDETRSLLILGGAVPGPRNAIVMVRKA
jgi:ribosomal protein L3